MRAAERPDQIVKLKNLTQKHPAAQIAAQLGSSRSATSGKAYELKLSLRMPRQLTEAPSRSSADPVPAGFDWHD
jgi:hypothetical protein